MRVFINVTSRPKHGYVVHLRTPHLVEKIMDLIGKNRHPEAIVAAFREGVVERQVKDDEIHNVEACLMLSETSARWDLTV